VTANRYGCAGRPRKFDLFPRAARAKEIATKKPAPAKVASDEDDDPEDE